MGRLGKVEEDLTPTGILASDSAPSIDLEPLLELLRSQAQVWRQELKRLRRSSDTPREVLSEYELMLERMQIVLNRFDELGRVSSGGPYNPSAVEEMEAFKEWAAQEVVFLDDPIHEDKGSLPTRVALTRTLLAILEEFI